MTGWQVVALVVSDGAFVYAGFLIGIRRGWRHAWVAWTAKVLEAKRVVDAAQSIMAMQARELLQWRKGMEPVRHLKCGEPITLRRRNWQPGTLAPAALEAYCETCAGFVPTAELSSQGPFSMLVGTTGEPTRVA
jgi:hypothetical protein